LFGVPKVTYIGHIPNAESIKQDPAKVQAIRDMPAPNDKKVSRAAWNNQLISKVHPPNVNNYAPNAKLVEVRHHF